MVVARVVETQRKPLETMGNRAKSVETQGSADSDDSRLGFDDPGCNYHIPGDLRVATFRPPGI